MEQDDRLADAMFEMCNHKMPLNSGQREWHIADIHGLLCKAHYFELDERYNKALTESFTSRKAENRYFRARTHLSNPYHDMDAVVEAGPEGLALIKAWQRARPRSSHAWLAEAQYWNHRAFLYRRYGRRHKTPREMWICAAACNEKMMIAVLNAIDCEPRQWMAATLACINAKVFGQPEWLVSFLAGTDVSGQPLMEELAEYHRRSPQEVEVLMAWSGLSLTDAVCPTLPRPPALQDCVSNTGSSDWLTVCLHIFPTAFDPLNTYIPFCLPRWGGSHEEVRNVLASSACGHLSAAEREHLALFIWWDIHSNLSIKAVDSPAEREQIIATAEEIAQRAPIPASRHNALEWLLGCYDDLGDKDALWRTLQRAVMEKVKLNNYYCAYAVIFAQRDFSDTWWIYNFLCQNTQPAEFDAPQIYRGYFQFAGLLGFDKDEAEGSKWLDNVADLACNYSWRAAINNLHKFQLPEHFVPLAELGAQRNMPAALDLLGLEYNDNEDNALLPYEPATALSYFQRAAATLHEKIALRDSHPHRLFSNAGYAEYEDELQNVHFSIGSCCQRLIEQESDDAKRFAYEKALLDNLYLAHQYGHQEALGLFLIKISEVEDLTLAHQHLALVKQEADNGTLEAMVSLAQLYGNKHDRLLFNMKLSARWAYFATALYPDDDIVLDWLYDLHFSTIWKRYRFTRLTFRIPDSELPGRSNSMA
ncbi:DUF4034 domain-containing protein [Kluyvera sp. 142486]|uniref:DUF4034 domain-containing protein n=1 Tax=Kluyvera sp. 142486 TaxID=3390050 RepID=UPI0039806566